MSGVRVTKYTLYYLKRLVSIRVYLNHVHLWGVSAGVSSIIV